MIDTWFFTALALGILALCVIMRGISAPSLNDRRVAGTVAVLLVSMAALMISIAAGMVIIIDMVIFLSLCGFGVMIWTGTKAGADTV